MPLTVTDVRHLIKTLGVEGAVAGLVASNVPSAEVRKLLSRGRKQQELAPDERNELMAALVDSIYKPPLKPVSELMSMGYDELLEYFSKTGASNADLMGVLKELNYHASSDDKRHLRRYVARQISETALFTDVAAGRKK
jgi:hypothetical protein